MLEGITQITILSLISVNMPALASAINQQLLSLAQLNILPSAKIDNAILTFSGNNDGPINDNFNQLGYNNINSIENMNSTFLFLVATCFAYCILMLIGICASEFPDQKRYLLIFKLYSRLSRVRIQIEQSMKWNFFIRFTLQQNLTLTLSSVINFEQLQYVTTGDILGSIVTITCLAAALISPVFFTYIIRKNVNKIENDKFINKYGSLTERMRTTLLEQSTLPLYSNVIDLIRTLVTVVVLVRLRNYSGLQIQLLIIVSYLKQAYILHARPYCTPIENRIALFNEFLISLYLYGIILLTDYNQSDELRLYVSYLLIGIMGVYTFINVGNFITIAIWLAWRSFKKACRIISSKIQKRNIASKANISAEKFGNHLNVVEKHSAELNPQRSEDLPETLLSMEQIRERLNRRKDNQLVVEDFEEIPLSQIQSNHRNPKTFGYESKLKGAPPLPATSTLSSVNHNQERQKWQYKDIPDFSKMGGLFNFLGRDKYVENEQNVYKGPQLGSKSSNLINIVHRQQNPTFVSPVQRLIHEMQEEARKKRGEFYQ